MRKSLFLALLCAVVSSACQKVDELSVKEEQEQEQESQVKTRSVQFVLKGLDVEYSTRATLASEGMTDLWVWEGETLLCHQTSADASLGVPTISLTIGAHDLTFVASKAEGQTWTDGVWKCTKVKDTFGTVLSYTVSKSSTSKQVQLARVNGKVMWTIEDAVPVEAKSVVVSVGQCYGLDAGLGGVEKGALEATFDVSGYAGTKGLALSAMVLPEDHTSGSVVTASVTVKKADGGVMCEYDNEVRVKANQVCNIHGSFFSGGGQHEVSLINEWSGTTDYEVR